MAEANGGVTYGGKFDPDLFTPAPGCYFPAIDTIGRIPTSEEMEEAGLATKGEVSISSSVEMMVTDDELRDLLTGGPIREAVRRAVNQGRGLK